MKQYIILGLAVFGLILFIYFLRKTSKKLQLKIQSIEKNILFGNNQLNKYFKFITPRREKHILGFIIRFISFCIGITFLILYLPFIFSLHAGTEELAHLIFGWIKKPLGFLLQGFLDFLPNLFFISVIYYFTKYCLKLLKYITGEIEREAVRLDGFHADWARPTFNILRIVIIAFAVIIVFPYIPGSDSPAFKGVSIFFGVLFSLGSTSAISNIVAGIVITYMRPFKVGDRVQIGDTTGDIMERSILVTRVKTVKNLDITIPNSAILNNHIINFTTNATEDIGVILHTSVTIGYDVPSKEVVKALIEGANNTELLLKTPQPFVLIKALDDFYVNYEVNAYTKQPNKSAVIYSNLLDQIKNALHDAGIEILSPHYSAIRDANTLTVPPENVPENYQKPGFSIDPLSFLKK